MNRLTPRTEAEKMAQMAGGEDELRANAIKAFEDGDFQWSAQLSDHLLALNDMDKEIIELKSDALMEIAKTMLNATGRNYMNSYAIQLKEKAGNLEKK